MGYSILRVWSVEKEQRSALPELQGLAIELLLLLLPAPAQSPQNKI